MSLPMVSVIIDTYNYGHFIEQAIDSVLSQDFPADRMEVLVIDDGSTDDTADRIKKYGSRIQYFRKENGGQASAFNFGFSRACGEIICLLDADDFWLLNKLRRTVQAFASEPVGMVSNNYELSSPDSGGNIKSNLELVSGDISKDIDALLRYCIFPTSCLSFRRETLDRLLPMPENIRLQADAFLALLAVFVAPVSALSETLTIYRIHGQNLYSVDAAAGTRDRRRSSNAMRKAILSEMHTWFRRNGFDTQEGIVRTFLEVLSVQQEGMEFTVDAPTRFQLFSHVLHYNRTYRNLQSWKLTVINYFLALAALVCGYKLPTARTLPREGGHHV
jgi:glycosyltransferase involved in cell wall biosynthesis